MSDGTASLLPGRNTTPLRETEVRRAVNTFLGLDENVPVRHEDDAPTAFCVDDQDGEPFGYIRIGKDIYPGPNSVDANSALSLKAAAAHELTHYYRWVDKRAIDDVSLAQIDEALTSLEAILRYPAQLNENDQRQLVADAVQRLRLLVQSSETSATALGATPTDTSHELPDS